LLHHLAVRNNVWARNIKNFSKGFRSVEAVHNTFNNVLFVNGLIFCRRPLWAHQHGQAFNQPQHDLKRRSGSAHDHGGTQDGNRGGVCKERLFNFKSALQVLGEISSLWQNAAQINNLFEIQFFRSTRKIFGYQQIQIIKRGLR